MGADVIELLDHHRAMLMAGVGDAPEVFDDAVVAMPKVTAREHRGAVHRHRLDHDHRGPANRTLPVVAEMALHGQPLDAHVGGVRAEVEAVREGLAPERQWREQMGEIHPPPIRGITCTSLSAPIAANQSSWWI